MEFVMKKYLIISLMALIGFGLVACASDTAMEDEMAEMNPSIAEIAVEDGRFTTLVAALDAAGLVETLSSEGNFTVFAPTDDAFAMLPDGTVEALLQDIPTLTDILLYHVLADEVYAETVMTLDGASVETLSGETVMVKVDMGSVYINESKVIITDIKASNGVIHVIDAVLLPGM